MTPEKAHLPDPYSHDFRDIVTHVHRVRDTARLNRVNSVEVASLLKAGSNVVMKALGPPDTHAPTEPHQSGLRFLTQRAVVDELGRLAPPFMRLQGDGCLRATWESHDDYISDLLAFMFHPINYDHQYGARLDTQGDWLIQDDSFVEAIDRTTYHELRAISAMPLFRLQVMLAATAARQDRFRAVIASNYRGALGPWMKLYEETFAARGFRLRPGVSLQELADMLAAVVEGFAIRHLGDSTAEIVGDSPTGNLVGKAVLGILNSYLVPVDAPDGPPLREEFDRRVRQLRKRR
jgi:hypothetical protein